MQKSSVITTVYSTARNDGCVKRDTCSVKIAAFSTNVRCSTWRLMMLRQMRFAIGNQTSHAPVTLRMKRAASW